MSLLTYAGLGDVQQMGRLRGFGHRQARMAGIPPGFAQGLLLSEFAEFLYKTTDSYAPRHEKTLVWNDGEVGVQ